MNTNKINHGFTVIKEVFIDEINALVRMMEHDKSGARLMHIQNDDNNKTFSIAFRTPPTDDTGLPHILEHAVLCGSRKFPVKEPFVELAKGSLNTYLNAMTYADKTVYPIASQNDADFMNLMDVYLDAVFYPSIYDNPMILKQEGWNYKLPSKEDPIEYQGVVYNEMKGAFSSPEGVLFRRIKQSLFPDTTYNFESGGDPQAIPALTQDQFLDFHKQYYHPSNSYICLYGDGDIDQHLKLINDEYLSHFDRQDVASEIGMQAPFQAMEEATLSYPIAEGESPDNKTYLALNFAIGHACDTETVMAIDLLEDLLLDTPAAPLKKALIDAQIGQDVFGSYNGSLQQPVFSIVVKNSSPDKKDDFYRIVMDTLKGLVQNGINKKLVEGAVNSLEFDLREADFGGHSKGLLYATESLKSWLYGGDPLAYLKYEDDLKAIKSALTRPYLEEVIQTHMIDNTHATLITMVPKPGLTKETALGIADKLTQFKASLSESEINALIDQTKKLQEMQVTPDAEENLEKIPTLALSDLETQVDLAAYELNQEDGMDFIFTPQTTNHIAYLNVYYDLRGIEPELIPYIGMLGAMLGKLNTKHYSYEELNNRIDIYTGGVQAGTMAMNDLRSDGQYLPKLIVKAKALYNNVAYLTDIIKEIMLYTQFDQETRILEIIREMKSRLEMSISSNGHQIAFNRLSSYFTQKGAYEEQLKGLSFYTFICDIEKNYQVKKDQLIENLEKAYAILNNKDRMSIGLTCEKEEYDTVKEAVLSIAKEMDQSSYDTVNPIFEFSTKNEALLAPFDVQYVAKGYNFKELGYTYTGSMSVLKSILSLDYLWNKVRVQNGAYGCFTDFSRNGMMFFVSYRDPGVGTTLDTYDGAATYTENFAVSERDMVKYIIGTISSLDFPLTPAKKGERSQSMVMTGLTKEMMQQERDEILRTSQEDIKALAPLIKGCMAKNYVCALGNHDKLEQDKAFFDHRVEVFE